MERPNSLSDLESAALTLLLDGEGPVLAALRAQAESASVVDREDTGVGSFVRFSVAP
jgi:hypothetical protein